MTYIRPTGSSSEMVVKRSEILAAIFNPSNPDEVNHLCKIINTKTDVYWDEGEEAWIIPLNLTPEQFSLMMYGEYDHLN